jgi:replicative DNA helicase
MVLLARTNGNSNDSHANMIDRPVPYDLAAEEAVLGSLLIDRDAVIKIAPFLKPADFYREANGWIYTAILDLYHRREPADTILLASELDRQGKLEQVGNYAYLFHLINSTPTAVHVEYYAHEVERAAVRRRLITGGGQIAALGYEENTDLPAVLDNAEQILFAITQRINSQDFTSLRDILETYFDRMELVHEHKGTIVGVPSGFHDLDELTGGLQKSDLIIGAARPATGKTSFALSIAHNAALAGKNVGVFSLEMSSEQIVQRLLAIESGVDMQRLRLGYLNDTEWQRLSDAFGRLAEVPIYIDDSAALSVMELRSRARRLQAEVGVDLLIVDYLQLMQGRRAGGSDNRVQEVSEITRGLKQLARELDAPIIALSQLSRAVESRQSHVPMLSDLRESGSIEQDADIVMFIYREELYNPETERKGIAEIHVAKHRNGPTGVVPLRFFPETTRFADLEVYRQPAP